MLRILLAAWKPMTLVHSWKLPDGYDAVVKVMTTIKDTPRNRIEVDELDSTFTYIWVENLGTKTGLSIAANLVHSVDAYILRAMHRRCNYDPQVVGYADQCLESELIGRSLYGQPDAVTVDSFMDKKIAYYIEQYNRSGLADAVILPHLNQSNVTCLSQAHLKALSKMVNEMLAYQPFELVTVHDEFRAHVNNLNHVRQNYVNIMAELAESKVLNDLLSQLYEKPVSFTKLSTNLPTLIRSSAYALC